MKATPEQIARSRREATFPRCQEAFCNNIAGFAQTHCGAHRETEPEHYPFKTMPYETHSSKLLRIVLTSKGKSSEEITNFTTCLVALEQQGFVLMGPE